MTSLSTNKTLMSVCAYPPSTTKESMQFKIILYVWTRKRKDKTEEEEMQREQELVKNKNH